MSVYGLSLIMASFLKMVDFYIEKQVFDKPKLLEQKLKLLSSTMMNENARAVYKELNNTDKFPQRILN